MSSSSIDLDARIKAAYAEVRRTANEVTAASRMEPWNQEVYAVALADWETAKSQLALLQIYRRTGTLPPDLPKIQESVEPQYITEADVQEWRLTTAGIREILGPPLIVDGEECWERQMATEVFKYHARRVPSTEHDWLGALLCAAYPADSQERLRRDAQADYESYSGIPRSGSAAADRVVLHYLRHQCTCYDSEILGCSERERIETKFRLLAVIEKAFPWLAVQCAQERHRSAPGA